MVKLENISTVEFIKRAETKGINNELYRYIYELLVAYDITDFQKLKDFLESKNPDLNNKHVLEILKDCLYGTTGRMYEANEMDKEIEIYTFDNYKKSNIDDKTLSITDKSNNGEVLLYNVPLLLYGRRKNVLRNLSIAEIKELLGHVEHFDFENAFTKIRSFGTKTGEKIVSSIDFYEQQVLRQAQETDEREINLFTVNKLQKDEIVAAEIKYIVEYLLDNAKELVWGNLTDTQKKRLMTAVLSNRGEQPQKDRIKLIDAISNYTTLSELEQGVIKKKVLNRFIVR